jgi:hypothetical protein
VLHCDASGYALGVILCQINDKVLRQGAALSPILISLYINDIPIMNKKNKDYCLLFADDLVSLNTFKRFVNIEVYVQCYLKKLEKWLSKWRLMMSPTKCNNSVFSNNTISESNKIKLTLFNDYLQINDNSIFLGIRFDNKLSFVNHINYVQWCENYEFSVKCRFVTQICVILRCNFTFLMFFYVTRKINNFCKITNNHP